MRMEFIVETPENEKKIPGRRMIKIPKIKDLSFGSIQNDYLTTIENAWIDKGDSWVLPINKIPGNRYSIEMNGKIDQRSLQNLIKVYASANRDYSEEIDKYILNAHIKNIEFFEKSYKDLIIEGIPFQVKVELKKAISPIIPRSMQLKYAALQNLANAAQGKSKNELFKAGLQFRRAQKEGWDFDEMKSFLDQISDVNFFKKHLQLNGDFLLGYLEKGILSEGEIIPKLISVNTETRLTLKQPISNGELIFKRKQFQDELKNSI